MEMERASRYHLPLSLILFDIDHFKRINDCFGHLAGDAVLADLAEAVKPEIRATDLFARWGGEEFVLLLPGNGLEDALRLADKLRGKIEAHRFAEVGRVTCSFGVAQFAESESPAHFVQAADALMYRAKENGRNRVEAARSPPLLHVAGA